MLRFYAGVNYWAKFAGNGQKNSAARCECRAAELVEECGKSRTGQRRREQLCTSSHGMQGESEGWFIGPGFAVDVGRMAE